jgi:hypothetical protein
MEVRELLDVREDMYGQYSVVSHISQELKRVMKDSPNYKIMPPFARESLDMIANKIARILNGNYYYDDSWRDISGYATLALMEIEAIEKHETDNAP